MSLLLVRHGQASAGTDDYDRLSDLGKQQSRRLGDWLADTGHSFSGVVAGRMRRHRETFEGIRAAYQARGQDLPGAEADAGLDEFDHHAVFSGFARDNPAHEAVLGSREGGLMALGKLIHASLSAWSTGGIADAPETWRAFGERVSQAAARLATREDKDILVITSGGVISRLAQATLGASDRGAIDLNLALRNSAICEFHVRPYGLALGSWNTLPHLHEDRALWTHY